MAHGLEERKDEVRELRDSQADKDEPCQKSRQRHPVVQAEGRQRVERRPDERKDHQERPLRPADIEQPAHGGPEPGQILLNTSPPPATSGPPFGPSPRKWGSTRPW